MCMLSFVRLVKHAAEKFSFWMPLISLVYRHLHLCIVLREKINQRYVVRTYHSRLKVLKCYNFDLNSTFVNGNLLLISSKESWESCMITSLLCSRLHFSRSQEQLALTTRCVSQEASKWLFLVGVLSFGCLFMFRIRLASSSYTFLLSINNDSQSLWHFVLWVAWKFRNLTTFHVSRKRPDLWVALLYIELSGKRRVPIKVENWQSRQFSWIFNQNQHISRLEQCKLFVILVHCQSGLALNCLPTYIHACNARKREFKRYVNFWLHLKGCRLISVRSTV